MKIVVLNGTMVKGCTYTMKELFIKSLGVGNEVKEYYLPEDCPVFCTGCKACFSKDISVCAHKEYTLPIWNSILWADLIVIASPSYVFGATAQVKAVLDHLGTKWMAHSPEKEMFIKQAVILTNSMGAGMNNVIKTVGASLGFWGISRVYKIEQALFEVNWELVADKRKNHFTKNCNRVIKKVNRRLGRVKTCIKTKLLFSMFKMAHKMINKSELKKGHPETKDHAYWNDQGWLNKTKPWKD